MAVGVFSITRFRGSPQCLIVIGLVVAVTSFTLADEPSTEPGSLHNPHTFQRQVNQGPIQMTVTAGPTTARVAEPIELTLKIQAPDGVAVMWSQHQDRLGEFEIIHTDEGFDIPAESEGRLWLITYRLESLVSGQRSIPPIVVGYTDQRQDPPAQGAVESPTIPIEITTLLEGRTDPTRFRDIKGVVALEPQPSGIAPWAVAATAVGGVAMAVAVMAVVLKRRRAKPKRSADQWALEALQRLEASPLLEHGPTQAFYDRLTQVIREYLERRFDLHAPVQTTGEFLHAAQDHPALDQSQRDTIAKLLEMADRVKFARYETAFVDHQQALRTAEQWVEQTTTQSPNGKAAHHSGGESL